MRALERLSAKQVENVKKPGYYCDGGGLYLQVSDAGTKSWILRYAIKGRERQMGLGSFLTTPLKKARRNASDYRDQLAEGIDPLDARKAKDAQEKLTRARSKTFAECAKSYIAAKREGWSNAKHADQWTNTIETYCGPVFGSLPVEQVDTALVMKVLEPIWTKKPETATRLRQRIELVLGWATVSGYRTGDNPAKWRGHLETKLPKMGKARRAELGKFKHHAALPYSQVGAFIQSLRAQEGVAPKVLEFTILTAARTGEVIGAKREEFDLDSKVWTIPASRMKAKKEHRVPLTDRALELVREQDAKPGELVFNQSNMAMLKLLERMGRDDLTVHGFRSTFRDWTAEQTNYPREVCEMALAHTVQDAVEAAYRRGDLYEKRARLMAEWARYCERPQTGAKVVGIRETP
jgi:integrase